MKQINILFFGDQWDDSWRRRQELAAALAGLETVATVVYVELPLTLLSLLKFMLGRADRGTSERWKRMLTMGPIIRVDNLYIVTPLAPLPRMPQKALQAVNAGVLVYLERLLLTRLRDQLQDGSLVFWASHPYYTSAFLGSYGEKLVCYDNSDHFSFIGPCERASPPVMAVFAAADRRLTEEADLVFVNSDLLYTEKRTVNPHTHILLNGVNFQLFCSESIERREIPTDLVGISAPILGYVGYLGRTTDMELFERIAGEDPNWSIVVIGRIDLEASEVKRLRRIGNVHVLGEKPLFLLPRYICRFDVALSLYKPCYLNDSRCSLKILDYLAVGRPVVATNTAGAHFFAEVIRIARNSEDFLHHIREALKDKDRSAVERRMAFVRDWTWENRAKWALDLMLSRLNEREYSETYR